MPVVTTMTLRLGSSGVGFALAVHYAHFERRPQNLFGDGPNGERFAGSGSGDNAKPFAAAREFTHLFAVRCSRYVSKLRPTPISMVSHAARVGAMMMMRPVGGSAATKASWSGGRIAVLNGLKHGRF